MFYKQTDAESFRVGELGGSSQFVDYPQTPRGGGGGYSGFLVTGMIEWGQTSKPKKIPKASNKTQKNP